MIAFDVDRYAQPTITFTPSAWRMLSLCMTSLMLVGDLGISTSVGEPLLVI